MDKMKVIVLIEGPHESRFEENYIAIQPLCSNVILLKGEKNIIIDTGYYGFEKEIIKRLKEEGLKPENIDYVLNTHRHYDHISNNYLFKNAKLISTLTTIWYIGEKRADYYGEKGIPKIPEVEIIETPGHRPNHISFLVESEGKKYVIAGDAILQKHFENKFGSEEEKESVKKILLLNPDIIIPGHGPIIKGKRLKELRKGLGLK